MQCVIVTFILTVSGCTDLGIVKTNFSIFSFLIYDVQSIESQHLECQPLMKDV